MKRNTRNFQRSAKLHLCCESDGLRPTMEHIYFKDGFAYASDGSVAVKMGIMQISDFTPEEVAFMDDQFIHRKTYEAIIKHSFVEVTITGFKVIGEASIEYPFAKKTVMEGDKEVIVLKFPDVNRILDQERVREGSLSLIGMRIDMIEKLGQAFPCDKFLFRFTESDKAVLVRPLDLDYDQCIGIVMPNEINKDVIF